ncbi:hypothetical protein LINPERHAP1_LOCUS24836 [Linum perenne]
MQYTLPSLEEDRPARIPMLRLLGRPTR